MTELGDTSEVRDVGVVGESEVSTTSVSPFVLVGVVRFTAGERPNTSSQQLYQLCNLTIVKRAGKSAIGSFECRDPGEVHRVQESPIARL